MIYRNFKYQGWLYALAFLTAALLRFVQLGAMPLNDAEAETALQALRISQGLSPALSARPFEALSTSVLFFLYGSGTNFLARFFPALAGSLLVFLPLLFVPERIKPRAGVILAFFIALDPGLVAVSRQAASPIFALTFTLLALGFFQKNKILFAGVASALLLLSGPSAWMGLLGLGIAWLINRMFDRRAIAPLPKFEFFIPLLATFFLVGSLFLIVPNGLSAALASIPAFASRWLTLSETPPARLLFSLAVYQPFTALLAIVATARGWWFGSSRIIPVSLWFWIAFLLAIFLPAREIADLSWALIPLLTLAAIELTRNVDIFPEERVEVLGVVLLTIFIWTFMWLDMAGMAATPLGDQSHYLLRLWLLAGAAILLVLSLLLVAAGWSARIAQLGGLWGLALSMGLLGIGGAFGAAGLRGLNAPELWHPANLPAQADLLEATIRDMSEWGAGNDTSVPVMIAGIDSPALEWALRDHSVTVTAALNISSSPAFVITPRQDNPSLASAYRGQDFNWRQNPLWQTSLPADWLRWAALRDMPQASETIILWARDDLFIHVSTP